MVHSNRRQDGLVSPKVGVAYPLLLPLLLLPPGEGYASLYKEPHFSVVLFHTVGPLFSPLDRSLSPLDRTSIAFRLYCDFGSTCCALRDST